VGVIEISNRPRGSIAISSEDAPSQESQFSSEVIESGVQIIEELLKTWAPRTPAAGDEDVVMSDDLSPEAQLAELKHCLSIYQERIENNPWVQSLLTSL
jgi:DNA mismatch repair protein MSH2